MDPSDMSNSTLAFELIPLPFDSPAGHALLAALPRGIKGVEEVCTVLLQAVLRCAPLLDGRTARATVKWLRLLDWEVPDEVFARQ
jgi:hypothetical protein